MKEDDDQEHDDQERRRGYRGRCSGWRSWGKP
jgi:hypothetical protein